MRGSNPLKPAYLFQLFRGEISTLVGDRQRTPLLTPRVEKVSGRSLVVVVVKMLVAAAVSVAVIAGGGGCGATFPSHASVPQSLKHWMW